jgi:hypothetical protein
MAKKAVKKAVTKKRATKASVKKTPKNKKAARRIAKPTKRPSRRAPTKAAEKVSEQTTQEEAVQRERTWVVWQDGGGIWLGTPEEFRQSKRPETIVCDVLDSGSRRDFHALQRAAQLGRVLRQTYANCVRPWLQYDDTAQEQRIRDWDERFRRLYVEQ